MAVPSLRSLSPSRRSELADSLTVRLETELAADDGTGYPPGAQDHYAEYFVSWYQEAGPVALDSDGEILRRLAGIAGVSLEDESVEFPIGCGHFVVVDTFEPEVYEALDAREGDLELLGSLLFPPSGNEDGSMLTSELDDLVEFVGGYAVLVNDVAVHEAWRGMHLGLHATGAVLQELRRGCSFAALHAMEPGAQDESARRAAHSVLSRYWQRLGFVPWRDEVLILPFATTAFDHARANLERDR